MKCLSPLTRFPNTARPGYEPWQRRFLFAPYTIFSAMVPENVTNKTFHLFVANDMFFFRIRGGFFVTGSSWQDGGCATQPRPAKGFASGLRQSVRRFASHAFRNMAKTGMKKARIDMPRAGRENKDRDTPPPYYDFAASGICGQPLSLTITNRHVPLASSAQSLPMALSSRTVGVSHLSASEVRECPAYTLLYQFFPKDTGKSKVK